MKKYIGIICFVFIILALIVMYQFVDLLTILFGLLFFVILMLICVIVFSFSLKCNILINDQEIEKNEAMKILFEISNRGFLAIPLYRIEIVAYNQFNQRKEIFYIEGSVAGKQQKIEQLEITSAFLGAIHINIKVITVFDYIKLFQFHKKINQHFLVYVRPNIYKMGLILDSKEEYLSDNTDTYLHKRGNDALEVIDIRNYRIGDRLSKIHWKLTSKKQELMVKENAIASQYNVLLLLDFSNVLLSRNINGLMDSFLEIALSISKELLNNEILHYIVFYDASSDNVVRYPIDDQDSFHACIKALLQIEVIKHIDNLYYLYETEFILPKQISAIRINSDLEIYLNEELLFEIDRRNLEENLVNVSFVM